MGDVRNHSAHERPLSANDDITVVFHKVDSRDNNSGGGGGSSGDHDDDERPAERLRLQRSRGDEGEEEEEEEEKDARRTDTERGGGHSPEDGERKRLFCQPASCVSSESASPEERAREGNGAQPTARHPSPPCPRPHSRATVSRRRKIVESNKLKAGRKEGGRGVSSSVRAR